MRPQRCRCGNLNESIEPLYTLNGFNEAAALPLRKLTTFPSDLGDLRCFNEAAALPLRKPVELCRPLRLRADASMRPQRCRCGNRARERDDAARRRAASMRPQRCRCGNPHRIRPCRRDCRGFNEAAALPLRKPAGRGVITIEAPMLQ